VRLVYSIHSVKLKVLRCIAVLARPRRNESDGTGITISMLPTMISQELGKPARRPTQEPAKRVGDLRSRSARTLIIGQGQHGVDQIGQGAEGATAGGVDEIPRISTGSGPVRSALPA